MSGRFWVISVLAFVAAALVGVKWVLPTFFPKPADDWKSLLIGDKKIRVLVADDSSEMERGLGYRDSLGEDEGMVFIYPRPVLPRFWMKGMKFDLDFIWIREGKVVDIAENIPAPQTTDELLPFIVPKEQITWVLEVNSGFVAKHGVNVGDSVRLN